MEVETPLLSVAATTDPAIESLGCRCLGSDTWLHTSPEYAMKRLLSAGSGPIYQIARVFRDGESGRYHNPEFSLLEWYRPGFSLSDLMDEVADLVDALSASPAPREWLSYRQLFEHHFAINPHRTEAPQLAELAQASGIDTQHLTLDRDGWLDLLMTHCIAPQLGQGVLTFVTQYPASQAALARISTIGGDQVAERFELYLGGLEIANGYHELSDADEQRRRFEADNALRREQGLPVRPIDERLISALAMGLPDCSGVALGLDRLLMHLLDAEHIGQVLAFPWDRA